MARMIRPLVAGNWKMNGTSVSLPELAAIGRGFTGELDAQAEAVICVPATLLFRAAEILHSTSVRVGGQDCHKSEKGAHTGDISAPMLKDAGASMVIVGHSERRIDHGESDEMVRAKAKAALDAGLGAIICIGETQAEREAGKTLAVLASQLAGSLPADASPADIVIAYEPVWAIGTGLTPSREDIAAAHAHIRQKLTELIGSEAAYMRILYGGSVKPDNAAELMSIENVNGALIGGASLKASDFLGIAEAWRSL